MGYSTFNSKGFENLNNSYKNLKVDEFSENIIEFSEEPFQPDYIDIIM